MNMAIKKHDEPHYTTRDSCDPYLTQLTIPPKPALPTNTNTTNQHPPSFLRRQESIPNNSHH